MNQTVFIFFHMLLNIKQYCFNCKENRCYSPTNFKPKSWTQVVIFISTIFSTVFLRCLAMKSRCKEPFYPADFDQSESSNLSTPYKSAHKWMETTLITFSIKKNTHRSAIQEYKETVLIRVAKIKIV